MAGKVAYELMTPGEVVAARERCPLVFVPLGPLEWHGPHLPLGTDALHAHHVATRLAQRIGGVVLPPLFAGTETLRLQGHGPQSVGALGFDDDARIVGMDFPGNPVKSVYFEESAFGITVREVVRGLKADPFRLIVLLNGHGATNHQRTLRRIALEETEDGRVHVLYQPAWIHPKPPLTDPGHADRWETAIMLALEEPHVHLDRLPSAAQTLRYQDYGIVDGPAFDGQPSPGFLLPRGADPRAATRAEGDRSLEESVTAIAEEISLKLAEVWHPAG